MNEEKSIKFEICNETLKKWDFHDMLIESNSKELDNFEKELFMKHFSKGTLNIKGENYNIINGMKND